MTKTYKFKVSASYGFAGAKREDELTIEVPDDTSDDEVEGIAQKECWEWAADFVDCAAFDIELVNDNPDLSGALTMDSGH